MSRSPEKGAHGPIDPAALLPHGGAARWIEAVLERRPGTLVCRGRIPEASPFAAGGTAPALAAIELAAQAAAVLDALERAEAGEPEGPRSGYLVRLRSVQLAGEGIAAGEPLTARVERTGTQPPLSLYSAAVHREDGEEVCRGDLGTWVAEGAAEGAAEGEASREPGGGAAPEAPPGGGPRPGPL